MLSTMLMLLNAVDFCVQVWCGLVGVSWRCAGMQSLTCCRCWRAVVVVVASRRVSQLQSCSMHARRVGESVKLSVPVCLDCRKPLGFPTSSVRLVNLVWKCTGTVHYITYSHLILHPKTYLPSPHYFSPSPHLLFSSPHYHCQCNIQGGPKTLMSIFGSL